MLAGFFFCGLFELAFQECWNVAAEAFDLFRSRIEDRVVILALAVPFAIAFWLRHTLALWLLFRAIIGLGIGLRFSLCLGLFSLGLRLGLLSLCLNA